MALPKRVALKPLSFIHSIKKKLMSGITKPVNKLEAFICKMSAYPMPYILLSVLITDIIISCIFSYILFPDYSSGLTFASPIEEFFLVVLFAPIFETLIFQSFIIKKSLQYFNNDKVVAVIISALLFGLTHYYSFPYIIKATIAGALYGLLYFIIKKQNKEPYIYIALVHATYNLIGFAINHL